MVGRHRIPATEIPGAVLWLAGSILAMVSVWSLRYAFSIEPEARRLVLNGAYRFVRHPIIWIRSAVRGYLAHLPFKRAGGHRVAGWLVLTLARIHFEEQVLLKAFPPYESYRGSTGALMLRVTGRSLLFGLRRKAVSHNRRVA